MPEITAAQVKELRANTGAGMMDCKHALTDTGGDMDSAVAWLRKKGLAAAAKKAGRVASEGLVGIAVDGTAGAVVEVKSKLNKDELRDAAKKIASVKAIGASPITDIDFAKILRKRI